MKILVIKLSSIGDLFHALPAVHNLKMGLSAEIHWVTQDSYVDLVECFDDVDRVIPFYRRSFFSNFLKFRSELRREEYDLIIDMQGLLKSAAVVSLARGKRKIGPSFHREGTGLFYDEVAGKKNKGRHAVEENLDIISHLELEMLDIVFPVTFPDVPLEGKACKIGVVPVSRWETKNWPADCFAETVKRINKSQEATFYLLGGKEDASICGQIAREVGSDVIDMTGKTSLIEMGGVLKQMDLVISNDSGPVHISAAAGTPTLVIFGPTDAKRTGPYGSGHKVVTAGTDCQPCFSRSCHKDGIPCLKGVTPEHVSELAVEMLKAPKACA